MNLDVARNLDAKDPLASFRERFDVPANTRYFDGNSLGVLSHAVRDRVNQTLNNEWGADLITSWNKHGWIDLPLRVGDKIGALIGAAPGQTLCVDSISVNLFKALCAVLQLQPDRQEILSTEDNFPTDLYMVQGLNALLGSRCRLRLVPENELVDAINTDTAAVLVTEVNFRTGRKLDIAALTTQAHQQGALMIVDLAHSAGAMPVQVDQDGVDFAVGCTYKYLNAGPGAPAFIYVASRWLAHLQQQPLQPLYGWLGHADPFAFSPTYQGADTIRQFMVGTSPIVSLAAVDAAVDIFSATNMQVIRDKSLALGDFWLQCMDDAQLLQEMSCISPQQKEERGSQISFTHPEAYAICQALIDRGVVADFRAPQYLRIGFAPLYNTFTEVAEAVNILADIITTQAHLAPQYQTRNTVT
ncbi:kynureninase [Aliidiomarina indica]|uniref:kynureninase n=1 Tax=Aliidiomarina indica TaxID=2749147 RepID=UPI00188F2365|nr:kynureninase [Aliidiomarina indica]